MPKWIPPAIAAASFATAGGLWFVARTSDSGPGAPSSSAPSSVTVTRDDPSGNELARLNPCVGGTTHHELEDGGQLCLFEALVLPDTDSLAPYCHYITDRYFGFHWTEADVPDYTCPPGLSRGANGEGTGFCNASNVPVPDGYTIEAYCHRLSEEELGYVLRRE